MILQQITTEGNSQENRENRVENFFNKRTETKKLKKKPFIVSKVSTKLKQFSNNLLINR